MSSAEMTLLSLYRSYIRVIHLWPADPIRPTRNLKTALQSQVSEAFRAPITGTSNNTLPCRIHDARLQLDALQRLSRNEFKQKYPLSPRMLTPASNPNYYSKLVDMLEKETAKKNIEAVGQKSTSFFQRFFRTKS
ncbi:hypothetical protein BGZ65_009033 [Modicella reniformis]|uniref:Mitochondrial protein M19 n=1 Tax=Modicella reniformis TaxID=1440133 RepID=A0A9P6IIJ7_9FUNG|nr:hypothetical protein BGZ65_009033 [Modicella reniformis]